MSHEESVQEDKTSSGAVAEYNSSKKTYKKPSYQFAHKKKPFFFKKKLCIICQRSLELELEYKNVFLLRRFISERGKILPRRLTGNCMRHQRLASRAIKRARVLALLWFAGSTGVR